MKNALLAVSSLVLICLPTAHARAFELILRLREGPAALQPVAEDALVQSFFQGFPITSSLGQDRSGPKFLYGRGGHVLGLAVRHDFLQAPRLFVDVEYAYGETQVEFPDGLSFFVDPATAKVHSHTPNVAVGLDLFSVDSGPVVWRGDLRGGVMLAHFDTQLDSALLRVRADKTFAQEFLRGRLTADLPWSNGIFVEMTAYSNEIYGLQFGIEYQFRRQ